MHISPWNQFSLYLTVDLTIPSFFTVLTLEPVDIVLFEGWMLGFTALPHIDLPVHPDAHRCPAEDLTITATGVHGETVDSTTAAIAKECFKNETQNAEFDKAYRKAHNIMVRSFVASFRCDQSSFQNADHFILLFPTTPYL